MLIFGFRNPRLSNKSGNDHFKALDLKNGFLGDAKSFIYELILALVSLWLLVNSIKKIPKEKRPIDFFGLFYSKIFWLFYYYFASFGFKRGYGVKDRLDFILTEIKWYYNSNDQWKFILLFD